MNLTLLSFIFARWHRFHLAHITLVVCLTALVQRSDAQQYSWSTFAGAAGVSGSADSPGYFNLPFGIARESSGNVYVADYGNHVIRRITPGGVISTFAGQAGVAGSADGAKTTTARFNSPAGVAVDSSNNIYVTDFGNNTIRKIDVNTGLVSTLAGTVGVIGGADGTGPAASFNGPGQVTCDATGNLYFGDFFGHTIRKVTPAGVVTTLAGFAGNFGSADGTGSAARFAQPTGIAVDAQGTVYVCDEVNYTIRKITPAGVVTTLAGLAGSPGYVDGTGSAARFTSVYGLAFDSAGNLIVTERGRLFFGGNNLIRKVTPAGVVTTLAGLPGSYGTTADGTGSNARFNNLGGVINDGTSNTLLVVETNGSVIRRVGYDGVCTTWVGTPGMAGAANTAGVLNRPAGIARAPDGTWYVAEFSSHTIRRITPNGVVGVFAGQSFTSGSADGTGGAARFNAPIGVECDSAGNVFVADSSNHSIRKITPGGVVTTFAGLSGSSGSTDGTGSAARFHFPSNLSFDNSGNLYVPDAGSHIVRKITPAGVVTTLAGLAGSVGSTNGTGNVARFNSPTAVAVDAAGNVFVADHSNHIIRKVTPAGVVTTTAGLAGSNGSTDGIGAAARFNSPNGLEFDAAGNLLIAEQFNHTIRKMTPAGVVTTVCGQAGTVGTADGVGAAAQFNRPGDIEMDPQGNAYVANNLGHTIRKVTPGGAVTTWLGTPDLAGTTNTGGNFNFPDGTAVDAAGNVYVADAFNHTIRKITPGGVISTLAGQAGVSGSADGTGTAARFATPRDVAVDAAGNVYVTDSFNQTIRKVTPAGVVSTLAGQPGVSGSADGTGNVARFSIPYGLCVDAAGANLYVAESFNNTIRQVVIASGAVTTLAGQAGVAGIADGTGTAARFSSPQDTAVDAAGNVYVADTNNRSIRKIAPGGVVTTLAGQNGSSGTVDGTGAGARFGFPVHVALDAAGILFVADAFNHTIRRVNTTTAVVTTIGGLAGSSGSVDGTGNTARFNQPLGMALDAAGNLYVSEVGHTIRKGTRVGSRARLVQPALGAALPAPTTVFQWEAALGATQYALFIGTTPGAYNLYSGIEGTNLSKTVSLPPDTKVYVTLYSFISGAWQSNSYAFDPAPSAKAAIISPVQSSTLTSATLNLQWSAATGATQYAIWVGNSYGAYDLGAGAYSTDANSATFTGIPTDGGPVHVTLWSLINGAWQRNDYWYVAQSAAGNRPAKLNSPSPNGSTINGGGTTFAWSTDPGVGATSYAIWVGSTPGGYDLYSALTGTGTIAFASNIPSDGRRIYVTLWSLIGGAYLSNSYYFTCASGAGNQGQPASLFSPTDGSVIAATQAFIWNPASGSAGYALWIGSTPGGYDLYAGNEGLNTARTVPGLPSDGRVIHATLWSLIDGVYKSSAHWFYAGNAGATQAARLTSHASGQTLTDAANTFTWNLGTGVAANSYALWMGSTPGGYDLYPALESGTSRALTLPSDGRKLYATLFSLINGAYQSNSYVFTAPQITPVKAVLTSPANGSTFTGSTAALIWTTGTGVTSYHLFIGSTPGGYDLGSVAKGTATSHNLTGLPADGRPLYVTLWSLINGAYQSSSYVFNAWQTP